MSVVYTDTAPQSIPELPMNALRPSNKILASLPVEDYERILPHLKRTPMRPKQLLYQQDALIENVYLPGGGACALFKTTSEGNTAEVAVVGAEGLIGADVFFGLPYSPCEVLVQMAGPYADLLPAHVFSQEMDRRGALYNRVTRYSQALMMQIMQATLCNSLHSAEERCARWLLSTHDRAGSDEFRFTHEFLATMLGLRRPTVTIVVGALQAAGLIQHHRGTVRIIDRAGLEGVSCECYRVVKRTYARLLPEPVEPVGSTSAYARP